MNIACADWRHLVYLNYAVDAEAARAVLPSGIEPDLLNGVAYVCWVGKLVEKVRVLGIRLPEHQHYAHLSAHLCVKQNGGAGIFRLATWVPQPLTAKWFAQEAITVGPTHFRMHFEEGGRDMHGRPYSNGVVEYEAPDIRIRVRTTGLPVPISLDPDDAFFLERKLLAGPGKSRRIDFPPFFLWDGELLEARLPALPLPLPPTPESVRIAKGNSVIWKG